MCDARPAARLTVLTGPSGAGKGRVVELVRARVPRLWVSVAATTRPRREHESDGVDHFFVDRPGFERLIATGQMLEWAEFGGQLYGTPKATVRARLRIGRPVLLELDLRGVASVRATMPQARVVLLTPPGDLPPGGGPRRDGPDGGFDAAVAFDPAVAFDATVVNDHAERAAEELVGLLGSSVLAPAPPATSG